MVSELILERRGSLDGWDETLRRASSDALRIEVAPTCTAINLRGMSEDQSLITDAQRVLGIELPLMPNRWHGDDHMAAAWLGPDEWLLIAPDGEAADIEAAMLAARPRDPWLSVADVSHNYTCLVLTGSSARDVLGKGCSIDLRPLAFPAGACAQSIVAGARVLLRAGVGDRFELWVRNSWARHLAAWLIDTLSRAA